MPDSDNGKIVIWAKGELEAKIRKLFEDNKDVFADGTPLDQLKKEVYKQEFSKCNCGAFDSRENLPHSKDCPDYVELTQPELGYNLVTHQEKVEFFKAQMVQAITSTLQSLRDRGLIKPPDFKIEVKQDPDQPTMFHFSYEIPFQGIEFNLEVPDEG